MRTSHNADTEKVTTPDIPLDSEMSCRPFYRLEMTQACLLRPLVWFAATVSLPVWISKMKRYLRSTTKRRRRSRRSRRRRRSRRIRRYYVVYYLSFLHRSKQPITRKQKWVSFIGNSFSSSFILF